MKDEDYDEIEQLIGYRFKHRMLLQQAFTRKSYTQETHDGDNNEVLEFIGDKALDVAVIRAMSDYYGEVNSRDEYACKQNEGKLSQLKARLVESKMLAHRIDELGFAKYLIMGKGDRRNNVQEDMHVKEDLFEAIVGAVAIDSAWDFDVIQDVVELMLNLDHYLENGFDEENNYVSLVQQWSQKRYGELPSYQFYNNRFDYSCNRRAIQIGTRRRLEAGNGDIVCEMQIDSGSPFVGFGYSKSDARSVAAKLAYNYLESEGLLYTLVDEIGEPTHDTAISRLQEIAQKGYFAMPEYVFNQEYDVDGNPVWKCECHISNYRYYYWKKANTKKEAKRGAAYDMLVSIIHADGNNNDNNWMDEGDDE